MIRRQSRRSRKSFVKKGSVRNPLSTRPKQKPSKNIFIGGKVIGAN